MTRSLSIAVVHYHLQRGGVTRVIQNTVLSLKPFEVSLVLLTGVAPPDHLAFDAPVRVVPGLGYAPSDGKGMAAAELLQGMRDAAQDALGRAPDLWHIHNHALGKNPELTRAVSMLAQQGERVLLHIHDFAEDGRPALYRALEDALGTSDEASLYPRSDFIHYACLNDRDTTFLRQAGLDDAHLHELPNAIHIGAENSASIPVEPLILYPTRAIRRKNIGEFILWSAMASSPELKFAITLAPENPLEQSFYRRWKEVAGALNLPVEFEAGAHRDFSALLQSARAIATTSMAEGFGLAFLEPWLLGKPLLGRKLPEVTAALENRGVRLDALYERLTVPVEWVGRERFTAQIAKAWRRTMTAYARPFRSEEVDRAVAAAIDGDRIDFGRLDESMQEQVIRHVHANRSSVAEIQPADWMDRVTTPATIASNQQLIEAEYGLAGYGNRLMDIYFQMVARPSVPAGTIQADQLADQFLVPERFCLLRASVGVETEA